MEMRTGTSGRIYPSRYDAMVIDGYDFDRRVYEVHPFTVSVTDFDGGIGDYPVRLTVNGRAGATGGYLRCERSLVGPEYSLIRPQFREARALRPTLDRQGWYDYRKEGSLDAETASRYMADCAVLITYGGMSAMEAACVGTPILCVERSEDNYATTKLISGLHHSGAAWWWMDGFDPRTCDQIHELLDNELKLKGMSEAGMALVDGLGCKRVADAIEEML